MQPNEEAVEWLDNVYVPSDDDVIVRPMFQLLDDNCVCEGQTDCYGPDEYTFRFRPDDGPYAEDELFL